MMPLADPTRRAILARLATGQATVTELAEPFALTLPAISKHIKVLERAGLIRRSRRAQSRPCALEPAAFAAIASWADSYRPIWDARFDRMETYLQRFLTLGRPAARPRERVSMSELAGEVLSLVNRSGNRPSEEGAADEADVVILLCRHAGFRKVRLRGDTAFSQTKHLDRWDAAGVLFQFGYDAAPNLVELAENLPESAWKKLQRPAAYTRQGPPRARPARRRPARTAGRCGPGRRGRCPDPGRPPPARSTAPPARPGPAPGCRSAPGGWRWPAGWPTPGAGRCDRR